MHHIVPQVLRASRRSLARVSICCTLLYGLLAAHSAQAAVADREPPSVGEPEEPPATPGLPAQGAVKRGPTPAPATFPPSHVVAAPEESSSTVPREVAVTPDDNASLEDASLEHNAPEPAPGDAAAPGGNAATGDKAEAGGTAGPENPGTTDLADHSQPDTVTLRSAVSPNTRVPRAAGAHGPEAQCPDVCATVPEHAFSSTLLLQGVGRYGWFVEGENLENENAPTRSYRATMVGAQATFGFMPAGKTFLMAGRLHGGAYFGRTITSGTIGAAVLFGANLARKPDGRTFSYALGGFGVEYIPQKKQDILTLHISGGTVLRGIDFGAHIDLGGNDEFARFMLGMHLGWGRLL